MASEREEGLEALQRGDFDAAALHLEATVLQTPNDFQAYLYLGGIYHHLQRYADAIRALTTATTLQPASAQAHYNLGVALEENGDLKTAYSSFQTALRLLPEYPMAIEALERVKRRLPPPAPANNNAATRLPSDGPIRLDAPTEKGQTPPQPFPSPNPDGPTLVSTATSPATNELPSTPSPTGPFSNAPTSSPTNSLTNSQFGSFGNHEGGYSERPDPTSVEKGGEKSGPGPYRPSPTQGRPPSLGDYMPYPQTVTPPFPGTPGPKDPMDKIDGVDRMEKLDRAGNPIDTAAPPRWGAPPGQAQAPFGVAPNATIPPSYRVGQQPAGTFEAPRQVQYVIPQRTCEEARTALVMAIVGMCVPCTIPIVHPISLYLALRAKQMIAKDNALTGNNEATIAAIISGVTTTFMVIGMILLILLSIIGIR